MLWHLHESETNVILSHQYDFHWQNKCALIMCISIKWWRFFILIGTDEIRRGSSVGLEIMVNKSWPTQHELAHFLKPPLEIFFSGCPLFFHNWPLGDWQWYRSPLRNVTYSQVPSSFEQHRMSLAHVLPIALFFNLSLSGLWFLPFTGTLLPSSPLSSSWLADCGFPDSINASLTAGPLGSLTPWPFTKRHLQCGLWPHNVIETTHVVWRVRWQVSVAKIVHICIELYLI